MNAPTIVARLSCDEPTARLLAAYLGETLDAADSACAFEDDSGHWQVAIYFRNAPDEVGLRDLVKLAAGEAAAEALSIERIPGADWVARSLAGLRPVRAGRFIVHGAHDRAGLRANDIGIEIEAALAFGTGHHGTTRGCLLALADLTKRRRIRNVLDIGTGSGVLAIAAARLLRTRITAGDIDPVAVRAARDNAGQNHALSMVTFVARRRCLRSNNSHAWTLRPDLCQHSDGASYAPRRVGPQTRRPRSPCCPFWPAAWPRQCCRRDLSRPRPFAGAADHP